MSPPFGFNAGGPVAGPGQVYEFSPNGHLLRQVAVTGSTSHLLGLAFHPTTGKLLVADLFGPTVYALDPATLTSSLFVTLPSGAGPNAIVIDKAGNVYISDSFGGAIYKTGAAGGAVSVWATSPLLATSGVPPFGANGMAFNHAGDTLYVANTGDDRILKIAVNPNGSAGALSVFVNSINGADGIAVDGHDNLWVAANQEDEIVVVNPAGKVIAKLGDFYGVDNGRPRGLLFPASLAFSNDGHWLYVTNLALDLRIFNQDFVAIDSPWTALVDRYTVSKIPGRIPPIGDRNNDDRDEGDH